MGVHAASRAFQIALKRTELGARSDTISLLLKSRVKQNWEFSHQLGTFKYAKQSFLGKMSCSTVRNLMASKEQKKPWLDDAIRHLAVLCKQAEEYADEGDTRPTECAHRQAVEVLRKYHDASAPAVAISVNGDIVFSWLSHGDTFKAFVRPGGEVCLFRNKALVDQEAFKLTAIPA